VHDGLPRIEVVELFAAGGCGVCAGLRRAKDWEGGAVIAW
jgi:hypothetical protein